MNVKFSRQFCFLIAPILLLGATFWVRDSAWKKTEVDFRQDVKSWTKEVPTIQVWVENTKPQLRFKGGVWDTSDFLSTIEKIHLTRSQTRFPKIESLPGSLRKESIIVVSLNDGGSVGAPQGFYLSLEENRGWVDIPAQHGDNWKDKGYELAPQTCEALKKHLFSLQDKNGELVPAT